MMDAFGLECGLPRGGGKSETEVAIATHTQNIEELRGALSAIQRKITSLNEQVDKVSETSHGVARQNVQALDQLNEAHLALAQRNTTRLDAFQMQLGELSRRMQTFADEQSKLQFAEPPIPSELPALQQSAPTNPDMPSLGTADDFAARFRHILEFLEKDPLESRLNRMQQEFEERIRGISMEVNTPPQALMEAESMRQKQEEVLVNVDGGGKGVATESQLEFLESAEFQLDTSPARPPEEDLIASTSKKTTLDEVNARADPVMETLGRLSAVVADLRGKIDRMEVEASKSKLRFSQEDVPEPIEAHQGSAPGVEDSESRFGSELHEVMLRHFVDPLQQTFWDVPLVCGHYSHGLTESAAAISLLMTIVGINGMISYILVTEFADYEPEVDAARQWREDVGHWSKYAAIDGKSMARKMCQQDQSLMTSASQFSQFTLAKDYHAIVFGAPLGVALCCWCVLIFFFLIVEEVQKTINRVITVFHLERKGFTSIVPSCDGFILCSLSRHRLMCVLMVCVLRMVMAFILLYSGSLWLVFTEDIENLILNSVALVFILDIDELVYRIACPSSIQAIVDNMKPLKRPSVGPLHVPSRAISTLCGAALALVLFGAIRLGPFAADVFDEKDAFCGGDTNFVLGKNEATGIVFAYHHTAAPQANVSKLMGDVVWQLRDGKRETNHLTSPTYQAFESSIASSLVSNVALFGDQCTDIQPNDPQKADIAGALLAAMKDRIGISADGITNCSQLNFGQCAMNHPIIRLACPVTCGCASYFHGNFLMSGCPFQWCMARPSYVSSRQSQSQSRCDIDQDVLPIVPEWVAYWQSFQGFDFAFSDSATVTLRNWESKGLTRQLMEQKFHQFGCGTFQYFETHTIYKPIAGTIKNFFCEYQTSDYKRALTIFCPQACTCFSFKPFCPPTPSATASRTIACAGLNVRSASLLNHSQCWPGVSRWAANSNPVGWYKCSPNAWNGKNVYTFDDPSKLRWQIRWESASHYEYGASLLGQKIGLMQTSKWTLSVVDQSSIVPAHCRHGARFFFSNLFTQVPSAKGWFPRNSSNTDVDCATGNMTTDGADWYLLQPNGSTVLTCPSGYAGIHQIFYRPLFWHVVSKWKEKIRDYTMAQCQIAAVALGLPYKGTQLSKPGGCYIKTLPWGSEVWLNQDDSVTASCSNCHPICMKCEGSQCQRLFAIFAASTSGINVHAMLRSFSTCPGSFLTKQTCNMAASVLALPDNIAHVGKYVDSPPGCYYNTASRKLYFNEDGYGDCTSLRNCVCQFHDVAAYELQLNGSCAQHITGGLSACSSAAVSLGLSDTTASSVWLGNSYDPPYCYYQSGSLKYNPGINTGACSSRDKCLCHTCAKTGTNPYSDPNGVCCAGSSKRREALPFTSSVYCDPNDPNYGKSCWDMRWVCKSQPKYCVGTHQADVVFYNASLIQWTVGACSAGSYVAAFTYALASEGRHLDLLVNGVIVQSSLTFPASGSWSAWLDKPVLVLLVAGSNTIKLLAINSSNVSFNSSSNANFNKLTLSKADLTTSLQFAIRATDSNSTYLSDPVSGMTLTARQIIFHAGHACWDLDSSYLQYVSGVKPSLGRFYTQAVWVYWRSSDIGFRTLFHGNIDHTVIVNEGTKDLGMFSNRSASFWDSGYNITHDMTSWQLVVVTGSGDTASASTGTSIFYTAIEGASQIMMRGKAARVASGTTFDSVGYPGQGPGKVAAAYQWNRILTFGEINSLLTSGIAADVRQAAYYIYQEGKSAIQHCVAATRTQWGSKNIVTQCCMDFGYGTCERYNVTDNAVGCHSGKQPSIIARTHLQAEVYCQSLGNYGLCSKNCKGTGCSYDSEPIWTSTPCLMVS